jgi:hypothetical protein
VEYLLILQPIPAFWRVKLRSRYNVVQFRFLPWDEVFADPTYALVALVDHLLAVFLSLSPLGSRPFSSESIHVLSLNPDIFRRIRGCLKTCQTSQATDHEMDHRHTDHDLTRLG